MKSRRRALFAVAVSAILTSAAAAAPLDQLVPADAVLYVGWQGADALAPQYAGSNLQGFLDASDLPVFLSTTLPQLIGEKSGSPTAVALQFQMVKTLLAPYWHHATAAYVGPLDFSKDRAHPIVQAAILCDAGPDAKRLEAALTNIVEMMPEGPQKPKIASDGSVVILAAGMDPATLLLAKSARLAGSKTFSSALAAAPSDAPPAVIGYFDMQAAIASIDGGLAGDPSVPPTIRPQFHAIIDGLGISAITQVAMTGTFQQKRWTDSSFIGLTGPPTGLVRLLAPPPFPPAALAAIPENAVDATVVSFDLQALYADLRGTLPKIDPMAVPPLDAQLKQFQAGFGLDLEKDLLAPLGNLAIMYRAPGAGGGTAPPVLALQIKDRRTFAATLTKVEGILKEASGGQLTPEKVTTAAGTVTTVALPQVTVAYAQVQDGFYVSTMGGLVPAMTHGQAVPPKPDLSSNPGFIMARQGLPANLSSLAYSDPAALYPEIQRAFELLAPAATALLGVELPTHLLPPPARVASFFSPSIGASWSDAQGVHFVGHSAFPGASAVGSQQGTTAVAVVSLGTAILLPSLGRARELSNRAADAASLRGITQSCLVYSSDHNDHLPDDLSQLVIEGQLEPKLLVTRRAGTVALPLTPGDLEKAKADPAQLAKDLAAHSDFVYLGKGGSAGFDAGIVLVYEKPSPRTADGINVGFEDAHVEFVRFANLADAFHHTNEYRKAHNLPEIDTDTLKP